LKYDLLLVLIIVGLPTLAALPTVIGLMRDVEDKGLLILFNVLGAVTVAGWFGAMVLACRMPKRARPRPMSAILPAAVLPWPDAVPPDDLHWPLAS
jgi:hypothetical protein